MSRTFETIFRVPYATPNGLQATDDGLWIAHRQDRIFLKLDLQDDHELDRIENLYVEVRSRPVVRPCSPPHRALVAWFKAHARDGRGYQTDINGVLREHVQRTARSVR